MKFTLIEQINKAADADLAHYALMEEVQHYIFGDEAVLDDDEVKKLWESLPVITEYDGPNDRQGAMGRAAERDWLSGMQQDKDSLRGSNEPRGIGLTADDADNVNPEVGQMVMLGGRGGIGRIIACSPPTGRPIGCTIENKAGQRSGVSREQLSNPKKVRGPDGKPTWAWALAQR